MTDLSNKDIIEKLEQSFARGLSSSGIPYDRGEKSEKENPTVKQGGKQEKDR